MNHRVRSFFGALAEPWFPNFCARCGASTGSPCDACLADLQPAEPLVGIYPLDSVHALVHYDDASRPFIADLKFRGSWATARTLAPGLAFVIDDFIGLYGTDLLLTWAPTTKNRVRERGFDQAEVLAREVANCTGLQVRRTLARRSSIHQTGRTRRERAEGVAYEAIGPVTGPIILFDDVVTTGATLRAAGGALREAGADSVMAVALAATPDRSQTA